MTEDVDETCTKKCSSFTIKVSQFDLRELLCNDHVKEWAKFHSADLCKLTNHLIAQFYLFAPAGSDVRGNITFSSSSPIPDITFAKFSPIFTTNTTSSPFVRFLQEVHSFFEYQPRAGIIFSAFVLDIVAKERLEQSKFTFSLKWDGVYRDDGNDVNVAIMKMEDLFECNVESNVDKDGFRRRTFFDRIGKTFRRIPTKYMPTFIEKYDKIFPIFEKKSFESVFVFRDNDEDGSIKLTVFGSSRDAESACERERERLHDKLCTSCGRHVSWFDCDKIDFHARDDDTWKMDTWTFINSATAHI